MAEVPADLDPGVQDALRELMQEDYTLLLDTFSHDAGRRLERMRSSLQAQDWEEFRQTAHSFKGSCGNMGATALQAACEEAERAGLAADAAAAQRSFDKVQDRFQRLAPLLGI